MKVKHCTSIAKGDIDTATQILLHRQETGQCLTHNSFGYQNPRNAVIDDAELKNRIIARYSKWNFDKCLYYILYHITHF